LRDGIATSLTLLQRIEQEADVAGRPTGASGWFRLAWSTVAGWTTGVWDFELFAASDTVQVDGHAVTTSRGVTIGKSIGMLALVGIGYWVARALSQGASLLLARFGRATAQSTRVARRWIMWVMMLGVVLLALRLAHIPVTAFAFLGGALALGFGFGAQNVLKNFISGVIILFERKIRAGDVVSVGGVTGTVSAIDLRATTLRGADGIDTIVPNSTLLESQVNNWSLASAWVRRSIMLTLPLGIDPRHVMDMVVACARERDDVLQQPAPNALLEDIGGTAVSVKLQYWIRIDAPRAGAEVDSELRLAVIDRLAAAGIALAPA
jgi:small-conductance mechanosensitive channel